MNSTSSLLQQLRIDRDESSRPGNGNQRRLGLGAGLVAALVGGPMVGCIAAGSGVGPESAQESA